MKILTVFILMTAAALSGACALSGGSSSASSQAGADTTPPAVVIVSPTNADQVGTNFTVRGVMMDDSGQYGAVTVVCAYTNTTGRFPGYSAAYTDSAQVMSGGDFYAAFDVPVHGDYVVQALGSDKAGNSTLSAPVVFTVRDLPVVSLTNPSCAAFSIVTNMPASVVFSGTAAADSFKVRNVYVAVNGVTNAASGTMNAYDVAWTCAAGLVSNATNTVAVYAVNSRGSPGQAMVYTFVLDSLPPVLAQVNLADGMQTATNVSLAGLVNDSPAGLKSLVFHAMPTNGGTDAAYLITTYGTDPFSRVFLTNVQLVSNGAYRAWFVMQDLAGNAASSPTNLLLAGLGSGGTNGCPALPAPVFSPQAGSFTNTAPFTVIIYCPTNGATVFWSTNGGACWQEGNSLTVGRTLTLQAKAFMAGYGESPLASGVYTLICVTNFEPATNWTAGGVTLLLDARMFIENDSNFWLTNYLQADTVVTVSNAVTNGAVLYQRTNAFTNTYLWAHTNPYPIWHEMGGPSISDNEVSVNLQLAINNGVPFVGYYNNNDFCLEIKYYTNGTWVVAGDTFNSANYHSYNIVSHNNQAYLAYYDNGSQALNLMCFSNGAWVSVAAPLSSSVTYSPSLAFNYDIPYIICDVNYGIGVFRYINNYWTNVGSDQLSAYSTGGDIKNVNSIVCHEGIPYIAFIYNGMTTHDSLAVMLYTNDAWTNVGDLSCPFGGKVSVSLAFDGDCLYLTYQHNYDLVVEAYSNGAWNMLGGGPIQSTNVVMYPTMAINDHTPYIAYSEGPDTYNMKLTLMCCSNDNWTSMCFTNNVWTDYAGTGYITGTNVFDKCLAFYDNAPCIAYQDYYYIMMGDQSRLKLLLYR